MKHLYDDDGWPIVTSRTAPLYILAALAIVGVAYVLTVAAVVVFG